MGEKSDERRYAVNLQGEIDSAALYRTLASVEKKPELAEVYNRLAAVEDSHAEFWRRRLVKLGAKLLIPISEIRRVLAEGTRPRLQDGQV